MNYEEFDKVNESFEVSIGACKVFSDDIPDTLEKEFEKFIVTLDMISQPEAYDIFSMLDSTDNKKQILLKGITSSGEEQVLNYIFIGDKYNDTGEDIEEWYIEGKKDWESLQNFRI